AGAGRIHGRRAAGPAGKPHLRELPQRFRDRFPPLSPQQPDRGCRGDRPGPSCGRTRGLAIVRSNSRAVRVGFMLFLLGLAVPAQAVIIPIYLVITRMHLYDTLIAIILPTAAFTLPISIVVLTSSLRDVPSSLYEAMALDGASNRQVFWHLVLPMSRPGVVTVMIFVGLNAWNNFIFPLVLTQSEDTRVLPLGLWAFQTQYGTDVPGLMAAVVLSTLPIFALYLFGRRQLLSGLAAGAGK